MKNQDSKDPVLGCPKGNGSRHRVQGKNNKRKFILYLCLAPYALCPQPFLLAKPFNFHPCKAEYEMVFWRKENVSVKSYHLFPGSGGEVHMVVVFPIDTISVSKVL